jgi:uncharacterized protein with PQ loop repeat
LTAAGLEPAVPVSMVKLPDGSIILSPDISLGMFVILWIGVLLRTVYGIVLGLWPVIVSNMVTFLPAGIIIVFKVSSR